MTTASAPLVSILLPVRNGMPYLPVAVRSLIDQTFHAFELIVIDDGSSDDTPSFLKSLSDPRVRVISSGGSGLAASLNAGLAIARGRYIARQDADDWSAPERLERQVNYLETHADVSLVATCAEYVGPDGLPVDDAWTRIVRSQQDPAQSAEEILAMMPLTCCLTHGSVMMRAAAVRELGGYDQLMVPAEDYDLWLRMLPAHKLTKLAERLYVYRVHGEQSGSVRRVEQTARVIEAKLRFVRRQVPGLPNPVRLVLPCKDRGADLFRRLGPSEGYDPSIHASPVSNATDVVAVTDFSALKFYASALAAADDYQQFGNLFVRKQQPQPTF